MLELIRHPCDHGGSYCISLCLSPRPSSSVGLLAGVNKAILVSAQRSTWLSKCSKYSRHCCYPCQYVSPTHGSAVPLRAGSCAALRVLLEDRDTPPFVYPVAIQWAVSLCLLPGSSQTTHAAGTRTESLPSWTQGLGEDQ